MTNILLRKTNPGRASLLHARTKRSKMDTSTSNATQTHTEIDALLDYDYLYVP